MFDKLSGLRSKSKTVNVPQPAGIVAPVKEKARTVVPPDETVKPAAPASPPEPPDTDAPCTSN